MNCVHTLGTSLNPSREKKLGDLFLIREIRGDFALVVIVIPHLLLREVWVHLTLKLLGAIKCFCTYLLA